MMEMSFLPGKARMGNRRYALDSHGMESSPAGTCDVAEDKWMVKYL